MHYSSWADIFVDGEHYYPSETTAEANRACGPEKIIILPGETRSLLWCYVPFPSGTHRIALRFRRDHSPSTKTPPGPPLFESGVLKLTSLKNK